MQHDSMTIGERMTRKGVSRRQFLKFCGFMAATLALPAKYAVNIAEALAASPRMPVIWLEFQGCTGDTESFLRAAQRTDPNISGKTDPKFTDLILDVISLDYHETIMAPAGTAAEKSRNDSIALNKGKYVCIVEGAIPIGANGAYCVIGGRSALSIATDACTNSLITMTVGSCAWDGGLPGANPNPTGAVGVKTAIPSVANKIISIPGCPANVVNIVASLVYYMTYNNLPAMDQYNRPLFGYGNQIHDECPRKNSYENNQFVLSWGDTGHRSGWCLYKMGCRGPWTNSNCPQVKWNGGTNWPIGAGHGCIGCVEPHYWDQNTPFYVVRPGAPD
jgi:hydrogenase small subunit